MLQFRNAVQHLFCPLSITVDVWQLLEVNMAEESLIEGEDENILYDLLVITEWPPETDIQVTRTSFRVHSDIMFRPPVGY